MSEISIESIPVAAYLIARGQPMPTIRPSDFGDRASFVFDACGGRTNELIKSYFDGDLCPARNFFSAFLTLRRKAYETKKGGAR